MMIDSSLELMMGSSIAALAAVVIGLFIWNVRISGKLRRMRRDYQAMMNGSGVDNLEQVITELQRRITAREQAEDELRGAVRALEDTSRRLKGRVGVVRYHAFEGQGSDLSFSVAIVDERQDGVVLSGIHNRDETYVYAKPLASGDSSYPLTKEERQAISQAAQSK